MKIIAPVILLLVAVGGFFGLTMYQAKLSGTDDNAFVAVWDKIVGDFTPPPPPPSSALANYLPAAPDGWTMREYATADGETLVNASYRDSVVAIDTTNSYLGTFEKALKNRNATAITYQMDDRSVVVAMAMREERDMTSLQGAMMTVISGQMAGITNSFVRDWNEGDFARLYGITFTEGAQVNDVVATNTKLPVNYRRFTTNLSGQLTITIMANANTSDADIAEIMKGIDLLAVNEILLQPDPRITPTTGFVMRTDGALSTTPRPPSPAFKAFAMLRSGVQIAPMDARFLSAVAEFDLKNWDAIYKTYGLVHEISAEALSVMGPQPELGPEQKLSNLAIFLLREEGRWLEHEVKVLEGLKSGRLKYQSHRARYVDINESYDPAIEEILRALPQDPPPDPNYVRYAKEYLATPERWMEYELTLLRAVADGEVVTQDEAAAITGPGMRKTMKVPSPEIARIVSALPLTREEAEQRLRERMGLGSNSQAAMGANPDDTVTVVRRAGQVRQGESQGGDCSTNELGVRQCTMSDEAPAD